MKGKKIMASLLLGTMFCQQIGFSSSGAQFSDVTSSDWYYGAVDFVSSAGLMAGTEGGTFSPHLATSRVMFVAILHRLAGSPVPQNRGYYGDVNVSDWYCNAVCWAKEAGVATGRGDGIFNPHLEMTREQLVVMLYAYEKLQYGMPALSSYQLEFYDLSELSIWSSAATKWAVSLGLVTGRSDGNFDPQSPASRAEVAQILKNYASIPRDEAATPGE